MRVNVLVSSIVMVLLQPGQASAVGKNTAYDSSANFLGTEVNKYVGQDILLVEKQKEEKDFGYSGFYAIPSNKEENVYRPNPQYYTEYSAVGGRHFKVLEAVKHDATSPDLFENGKCFLKLQERDSAAIVYYEYNSNNSFSFPFIITGFFEKQKKQYIGKEIVYNDNILKAFAGKNDVATGRPVTYITGQIWKCVDVQIPEAGHNVVLILQDAIGQKTTMPFGSRYYTLAEANAYKKKFGDATYHRVMQGNINVGMTKEMCKMSIGSPYSTKGELVHGTDRKKEEWLYDDGQVLFFDNDVLVNIKAKAN